VSAPLNAKYRLGDTVYHKTDEDPGIITGIIDRGYLVYEVCWTGRVTTEHTPIELSRDRVYNTPNSRAKSADDEHETCG